MIVDGQKNVKVHFAATENLLQFVPAFSGGAKYMLLTAFPLLAEKIGIKTIDMTRNKSKLEVPQMIHNSCRHSILDSGLFTLMFGSHKGKKDEAFIEKWYSLLTDFIIESGYKGSCVEVDCQKVLGVEKAWEYRKRMRDKIPNKIINVFHLEDGLDGLDRMIEFSDYIAISVPELRFAKKSNKVCQLARYIKKAKPSIDIHLLGCTSEKILSEVPFVSSADSSSWTSCVRYGYLFGHKISNVKKEKIDYLSQKCDENYRKFGIEKLKSHTAGDQRDAMLALSVNVSKGKYKDWAGCQE